MFTGCGTALVTPFKSDLSLDERTLRALVRRQVEAGIDFLVPCGTTGENPTLELEEHLRIVEITLDETAGRVPVLAGAGGYNTEHVIKLAGRLTELGVSGLLSVTPYYNKPTQEGVFQHFKALADSTNLPIILYSVQGRTNVNIESPTVARLAEIPNVVGIKEASGSVAQIATILSQVPDEFLVLSGDDSVTLPVISLGGKGVISVVANQIPGPFAELTRLALGGDFAAARIIQRRYQETIDINFIETNPGPVKYAMSRMGLLDAVWRLPLVPPQRASQERIEATLSRAGLLAEVHR